MEGKSELLGHQEGRIVLIYPKSLAGVTLIELMIAIVIPGVLLRDQIMPALITTKSCDKNHIPFSYGGNSAVQYAVYSNKTTIHRMYLLRSN